MREAERTSYLRPVVERDLLRLAAAFRDRGAFGPVSKESNELDKVELGFFFSAPDKILLEGAFSLLNTHNGTAFIAIAKPAFQWLCDAPLATLAFLKDAKVLRYPYSETERSPTLAALDYAVVDDEDIDALREGYFYVIEYQHWIGVHEGLRLTATEL